MNEIYPTFEALIRLPSPFFSDYVTIAQVIKVKPVNPVFDKAQMTRSSIVEGDEKN